MTLKDYKQKTRLPINMLCVGAQQNNPYNCDTPMREKQGHWFAKILNDLYGSAATVHIRRVHYKMISQLEQIIMPNGKPYLNTSECYDDLNYASKYARNLRLIDPKRITDERNEDVILGPKIEKRPASIELYTSQYNSLKLSNHLHIESPSLGLLRPQIQQPYMIEIWVEKSTMNDILMPFINSHGINLMVCTGQASAVRCDELVDRALADGRPCRVLYISDFDPSGQIMPVAVEEKFSIAKR